MNNFNIDILIEADEMKDKTGKKTGGGRSAGVFEDFLLNKDLLVALLDPLRKPRQLLAADNVVSKKDKEDRSTLTGSAYGLNKVFVAGRIPIKATAVSTAGEQTHVAFDRSEVFNEDEYATKNTIVKNLRKKYDEKIASGAVGKATTFESWSRTTKTGGHTAYEQPSDEMIKRVKSWIQANADWLKEYMTVDV